MPASDDRADAGGQTLISRRKFIFIKGLHRFY